MRKVSKSSCPIEEEAKTSDPFEEERVGSGDDGLLLLCDLGGDHPHQRPDHQEHKPQPEAA